MRSVLKAVAVGLAAVVLAVPTGAPAFTVFSDSGANAAAITDTVDAFRAALGNPNNANNAGPLATGRREINWDGGGPPVIDGTAPVTPFTVFQNTRGATFTTPGTGLTQAAATGGLLSLDLINPQYAALFAPFSPNRLFAPIGSNITDGFFSSRARAAPYRQACAGSESCSPTSTWRGHPSLLRQPREQPVSSPLRRSWGTRRFPSSALSWTRQRG